MKDGVLIRLVVPFDGDGKIFTFSANFSTSIPPCANVERDRLIIEESEFLDHGEDAVLQRLNGALTTTVSRIEEGLARAAPIVASHNASLEEKAFAALRSRRDSLGVATRVAAGLSFPARRTEAPSTYQVPSLQRRVTAQPPAPRLASSVTSAPEPTFELAEYEHILRVLTNMVHVMERSPAAFKSMDEEAIRVHFLVQLNAQYEGQATGETFNLHGKTDILVRVRDRNIFIAECKIWTGPADFARAIDQLRGYATWRDTKTALLVFNRNKNFSAVVQQLPALVREHPAFIRTLSVADTWSRHELRSRDDPNRSLLMTALAFDVPSN